MEKIKLESCSRCGCGLSDRWEDHWPNYGYLELGFAAQAFSALGGGNDTWKYSEISHPAMIKDEAQEVIFNWGQGYRYDTSDRYILCYDCQRKLLNVIGEFFKYGDKRTGASRVAVICEDIEEFNEFFRTYKQKRNTLYEAVTKENMYTCNSFDGIIMMPRAKKEKWSTEAVGYVEHRSDRKHMRLEYIN